MKFKILAGVGRGVCAVTISGLLASVGCAGTQKAGGRSALGGSGDSGAEAVITGAAAVPTRDVSAAEREDFDKAMAKYRDLKADGVLTAGECDTAFEAFKDAADDNPKLREARFNQGAVLMECGRENEAIQLMNQLASGKDAYAPAITELGVASFRKGDRAQAETLFTRAIQADPNINSVTARNNLSQILRDQMLTQQGDERKRTASRAIEHLRAVLAIDGTNIQAYATLCHIYQLVGYPDMAKLVGDQAIRRAAEIATGEVEEEQTDLAVDSSKTAKGKTKKEAPPAAARKAKQSKGTGYTKAMNQQLALVYNTLALIDLDKKNVTGAIGNFKLAISRDPELMEARMNLAAIALNFRDYPTAEENFRVVMKAQPQNYAAVLGLGVALRGNKKADEAEQMYLAAQKLDPSNPQSYYNLGLLYQDYKGGQKPELQKAQQYYRDYVARASSPALKRDAQKRIKDIDDMFVALQESEKIQAEYEKMLKESEEQQKKMQEQEPKEGGGGTAPAAGGPSASAAPQ